MQDNKLNQTKNPLNITSLEFLTTLIFLFVGLFGFFYVRSILKNPTSTVSKPEVEDEKQKEVKPAVAFVTINNGESSQTYRVRLDNINSFYEVVSYLHKNENLNFETLSYTFGEKIVEINGKVDESQGFQNKDSLGDDRQNWHVYMTLGAEEVEDQIKNLLLEGEKADLLKSAINNKTDITFDIKEVSLVNNGEYSIEYK